MEKTKSLTKLTIALVVAALIFGGLAASSKGTSVEILGLITYILAILGLISFVGLVISMVINSTKKN